MHRTTERFPPGPKFTTSIRDGIDLRETLRHWHKKELYVKEIPPTRGNIEVVVFLFDTPADPGKYSWRATWFAEHREESTLCFYATPFGTITSWPGMRLFGSRRALKSDTACAVTL